MYFRLATHSQIRMWWPAGLASSVRSLVPCAGFDPLDEARPYEWDDVPQHQHALGYLHVPQAEISETEVRIWDPDDRLRLTVHEILWDAGRNRVIRTREDGYELLIVQLCLDGDPGVWHTVRLNRHADGRMLLEHLQTLQLGERQLSGPSSVVSSPAITESANSTNVHGLVELRRTVTEVSWNGGRSSVLESVLDERHLLVARLCTQEAPLVEHIVTVARCGRAAIWLEHVLATGANERHEQLLTRRQLGR